MASTSDLPPSYATATGSSAGTRNGIPPDRRRSMEDENRPLPLGWVRQFDPKSEHQFFVDTTKEPPRSIWHHPYDDEEYLASLDPHERDHVIRLHRSVSLKDIEAESSDDEAGPSTSKKNRLSSHTTDLPGYSAATAGAGASSSSAAGPSSAQSQQGQTASAADHPKGLKKFGRSMKDKLTNTTHEQREKERLQRQQQEEEAYRLHMAYRRAFAEAIRSGQPQYLCKDQSGREVFIEPPNGPAPLQGRAVPGGGGVMGYNPYNQGPYTNPNARFVRPDYPYQRPMGYGYGNGYGMPLMGGLMGGMLLGGLLF